MALPDYADTGLPTSALVDSWSETEAYQDNISTDMAGGNKRSRRLPGDELARFSFDIKFTLAQFATFQTFVKTTLGLGTSRFIMSVWTGSHKEERVVQFASKYKSQTRAPSHIIVSFDLWIYPTVISVEPELEPEPIDTSGMMDFSLADNSGLIVLLDDI
jgi:hypothetical protein